MVDWLALQANNPEPSLLDAIEHAKPAPKRRVRIVHDCDPSDPRDDMDMVCQIERCNWRAGTTAREIISGLIRDTTAWRAAERLAAAANPDWTEDDLPDIEFNTSVREQWLSNLSDCLLVEEFWTDRRDYQWVAYTTPEMCAKLGVDWANAAEAMDGEVKMFKQWAEGDVYGFIVEEWSAACACDDCEAGEWVETDSCWGFYGSDPFENGMSEHIDEELHEQLRNAEIEHG